MVTFVLLTNGFVSLLCLYVAWRVWRLSQALAHAADVLSRAERHTYDVLHDAPEAILQGQLGLAQWRLRYQQLIPQFQQVRQALALISLSLSLWRGGLPLRRGGRRPQPVSRKSRRDRRP